MVECARCGNFTDNPAEGEYPYCDDCHARFNKIRENGVVVQQTPETDGYQVYITADSNEEGGTETSQVDALARGKYLSDKLSSEAVFEYQQSGSQWVLEEYLQAHPRIRKDVLERLSRIPDQREQGLFRKLRSLF